MIHAKTACCSPFVFPDVDRRDGASGIRRADERLHEWRFLIERPGEQLCAVRIGYEDSIRQLGHFQRSHQCSGNLLGRLQALSLSCRATRVRIIARSNAIKLESHFHEASATFLAVAHLTHRFAAFLGYNVRWLLGG